MLSLRLILDEHLESQRFKNALLKAGHDVVLLKEILPKGTKDDQVLSTASRENRILFTQDRGFVQHAKKNPNHHGIILEYVTSTPKDMTISERITAFAAIEKHYPSLENHFVIINSFRPKRTT